MDGWFVVDLTVWVAPCISSPQLFAYRYLQINLGTTISRFAHRNLPSGQPLRPLGGRVNIHLSMRIPTVKLEAVTGPGLAGRRVAPRFLDWLFTWHWCPQLCRTQPTQKQASYQGKQQSRSRTRSPYLSARSLAAHMAGSKSYNDESLGSWRRIIDRGGTHGGNRKEQRVKRARSPCWPARCGLCCTEMKQVLEHLAINAAVWNGRTITGKVGQGNPVMSDTTGKNSCLLLGLQACHIQYSDGENHYNTKSPPPPSPPSHQAVGISW